MKAILFPGQGSQKVGMGKEHYDSNPVFKARLEEANALLGFSITEIMFEGPADKLTETKYTQPAIFLHSVALFDQLNKKPDVVAGHSLGEFSALYAAGVLDFTSALSLVALRGEHMQRAGTTNPGTMAAIIGMDDEVVEQICEEASKKVNKPVVPANYNCPGQLVISGDVEAVEAAVEIAKDKGCRLAKVLPVSGAFHSPLMEPAYDALKKKLDEIIFSEPKCPVYSNYTAEGTKNIETIRENLLNQLMNPVRWTQTLQNMNKNGASHFIEVGPGKVLQGLVKRTLDNAETEGYE